MKLKRYAALLLLAFATGSIQAQDAEPPTESTADIEASSQSAEDANLDKSEPGATRVESDVPSEETSTSDLEVPVVELSDEVVISNLFSGYIEALGGERQLRKLESRVVKGSLQSGESKADFELYQSGEGHFLSIKQFPGNTERVGYDGEIFWEQSGDEEWTELSEIDAANKSFFGTLTGFLDWQSFYTSRSLLPDMEINGRPVKVVLAESESGVSQKIFFDQQNFRVVRIDEKIEREDEGWVTAERYIKGYRNVDSVVVPFIEETILPGITLSKEILSVEQNIALEAGLFNPPRKGEIAKSGRRDTERYFDSLTVGGIVYTNVWVHRQTNFNVLIRHAQGIHTIRLTDLPQEDLDELRPQIGDLANIEEDGNIVTDKWDELAGDAELQAMFKDNAKMAGEMIALVIVPFIFGWLITHLIWSYIVKRLCDKTDTKGGIAVWLPIAQAWPMFRAAGFSDKWMFSGMTLVIFPIALIVGAGFFGVEIAPDSPAAIIAGGLVFVGWLILTLAAIMWPFKICSRCKLSPILGLLMFVPVANIGLVLYLAFSRDE